MKETQQSFFEISIKYLPDPCDLRQHELPRYKVPDVFVPVKDMLVRTLVQLWIDRKVVHVAEGDTQALEVIVGLVNRNNDAVILVPQTTKMNDKLLDFLDYTGEGRAALHDFRGQPFLIMIFERRIYPIPARKAFLITRAVNETDPDEPRRCDVCDGPPTRCYDGRLRMTCTGAMVHIGCLASTVTTYEETERFAYTPPPCTNCPGCIRNLQFPIHTVS